LILMSLKILSKLSVKKFPHSMKYITIRTPKAVRKIGPHEPVFIIAELSGNHNQSYAKAEKLIDAAAKAGVDAIKLQTYTADTLTIDSDKKYFCITSGKWKGQTLYQLYQKAYTPWEWQPRLKKYAEKKGLVLFSTPFDVSAVDFLEKMRVSLYKVSSFEIGDIPLLKRIGTTKKPVIISRGMASVSEITLAVKALKASGAPQVAVLHCISSYPAEPEEMNLATIPDITKKFNVISGLSDHTIGTSSAIAGVALGASIIEKHITLKRSDGGPDAAFSLEPQEYTELVAAIRDTEKAIGLPSYQIGKKESQNFAFRKSIFVIKDIPKGSLFTKENIKIIRPGQGLPPKYWERILGKQSKRSINRGTPLNRRDVG